MIEMCKPLNLLGKALYVSATNHCAVISIMYSWWWRGEFIKVKDAWNIIDAYALLYTKSKNQIAY